jgi:hypothetical protein
MHDDAPVKGDASKDGARDGTSNDGSGEGGGEGGGGDGGITDARPGDTSFDDAAGGVQCYEIFTSGSQVCAYSYSNAPGFKCTGGLMPGSCPSSGLFGCCVITGKDAGATSVAAVCYYSPDSGAISMSACTGSDEKWQTTSP